MENYADLKVRGVSPSSFRRRGSAAAGQDGSGLASALGKALTWAVIRGPRRRGIDQQLRLIRLWARNPPASPFSPKGTWKYHSQGGIWIRPGEVLEIRRRQRSSRNVDLGKTFHEAYENAAIFCSSSYVSEYTPVELDPTMTGFGSLASDHLPGPDDEPRQKNQEVRVRLRSPARAVDVWAEGK